MFLISVALFILFLSTPVLSTLAPMDYLVLPAATQEPVLRFSIKCTNLEESTNTLNLVPEQLVDTDIYIASPSGCFSDQAIPFEKFYLVRKNVVSQASLDYSCSYSDTYWTCKPKNLELFSILKCGSESSEGSFVSIKQVGSNEIIANCIFDNRDNQIIFSQPNPQTVEAHYHNLYPLINEYLVPIELPSMPHFLNTTALYTVDGHPIASNSKTQDDNSINTHYMAIPPLLDSIELKMNYYQDIGISFTLTLPFIIYDQDLSAYYVDNNSTRALYILGKSFQTHYTYNIYSSEENIPMQQIECTPLTSPYSRKKTLGILACNLDYTSYTGPYNPSLDTWKLNIANPKTGANITTSFSVQQISLNEPHHSYQYLVLHQELVPEPLSLKLTVDPVHLASWILSTTSPHQVYCDFFRSMSAAGFVADSQTILCPVPKKYKEYLAYLEGGKYRVQVSASNVISVSVADMMTRPDQSPSFSINSRFLITDDIYSFSPLDPQIVVSGVYDQEDDTIIANTDILGRIWSLSAYSVALITMDLRFLSMYNDTFTYGVDWEIFITVDPNVDFNSTDAVDMPEPFLLDTYNKSQVHEFILLARTDQQFKIEILISNTSYLNARYGFINSTSVEIVGPYRANYGKPYSFYAMITSDDDVDLPVNLREVDGNTGALDDYCLELGSLRGSDAVLTKHTLTSGTNVYDPTSNYYTEIGNSYITMPYLPFFSNCKAFDKYIPIFALFEQNAACTLVSVENTVYIKPFGFGSRPTADSCSSITLECIIDEDLDAQTSSPRWFEQGPTTLFYITKQPLPADKMNNDDFNGDSENFIPVTVTGSYESGKIPSLVTLDFQYYQVSPTLKRLVNAAVTLGNFITPTDEQTAGNTTFGYNLTISFKALDHTDLIIAFEFEPYMYVVLYLFMGVISMSYMALMFCYHFVFSRNRKKLIIRGLSYIRYTLPQAAKGITFAVVPFIPMIIIIGATVVGEIWDSPVNGCSQTDSACYRSIFDAFALTSQGITDRSSSAFATLRNGRSGLAFIVVGFIVMLLSSRKFVKKVKKEEKQEEAYDGNVWLEETWTRSSLVFCCLLQIMFLVAVVQFSFSDTFGNNVYMFIGVMKIVGMTFKFAFDKILGDRILTSPMLVVHGIMESGITFGAANFLAFLISYYVDLGIKMLERPYMGFLYEGITKYLEEKYVQFTKLVKKTLLDAESSDDSSDESSSSDDEKEKKKKKKQKEKEKETETKSPKAGEDPEKNKKEKTGADKEHDDETKEKKRNSSITDESSDSNIILSDQDISLDSSMSMSVIADYQIESDLDESSDEFEREMTKRFRKKESEKHKHHQRIHAAAVSHHEKIEEEDETIDELSDYTLDVIILLFTPCYNMILWVFYSENQLASAYGIAENDVVFYVLFSLVIIPFECVVDIVHYNITEYYHGLTVYEILKNCKERFAARKTLWQGDDDDDDIDPAREEVFKRVEKFSFSSQYYYIITVYIIGSLFVMFGILTIIQNSYNCFQDVASYYLLAFFLAVTLAMYWIVLFIAKTFKIWEVKVEPQPTEQATEVRNDGSFFSDSEGLHFITRKFENWENIDKVQASKERLQEVIKELKITKFEENEFKSDMILNNHFWFTANIREVFTPTTLKSKRGKIIQSFKQIYGELSPRGARAESQQETVDTKIDMREKKIVKKQLTYSFIALMKQWKARATLIRKMRSQVAGIIEAATGRRCEFCGVTYYLRAEVMLNVESMFRKFLIDDPTQSSTHWSIEAWQEYFRKNAIFRTLCFDCYGQLLDHHRKVSVNETKMKARNDLRRGTKTSNIMGSSMDRFSKGRRSYFHLGSAGKESEQIEPRMDNKMSPIDTDQSFSMSKKDDEEESSMTSKGQNKMKTTDESAKTMVRGWLELARARVNTRPFEEGEENDDDNDDDDDY